MTVGDLNSLAYWYPKIRELVPTPRTAIVDAGDCDLRKVLDGKEPDGLKRFLSDLAAGADAVGGYPCFLRTAHGSGKHEWLDTCLIDGPGVFGRHVARLVEWSELVDMLGLPYRFWAVRELLPVEAAFTAFTGMPIARERRYFARFDGELGQVVCHHPYWPPSAIQNPSCRDWSDRLARLNYESAVEIEHLTAMTRRIVFKLGNAWSIDWLWVPDVGWYLTDMALATDSFHWADCPHAREFERENDHAH